MIARGSQWHRWDPHIHSPGTILNDQFGGGNCWDRYLTALESKTPCIRALAVTDYYLTDHYEEVLTHKAAGRLADVELIFPNVEMRLDVAAKSGFVNIHLLVSPEDPDLVAELARILSRLKFRAFSDRFDCTRDELIRLGKRAKPEISDNRAALREGATQFKVNFAELREVFGESVWAKKNILVAVAGAAGDGTSGLREAADATLRQEVEAFAHLIFASSAAQREFWLGLRAVGATELCRRYGGLKPCLHGCDAHSEANIGEAHEDRFTWIKGGLEFDALRQACIDPAGRAYVGPKPPATAMPSQVISSVTIKNADWAGTTKIPLNPSLVTIIGARGSGKTALAEMIAVGCDALPEAIWQSDNKISSSFLLRARPHLGDATVHLHWGGGDEVARVLDGRDAGDPASFPRARYLSQQFVEELCSVQGPSDSLIAEIERVIYEAHPHDAREGALNFAELRERRTQRFRQARAREADAIFQISRRIGEELEKERLAPAYAKQVAQKAKQIEGYKADLSKLVIKGSDAQLKRHEELQAASQVQRTKIERYKAQRRTFESLKDEVASMRATEAPEMLRQAQTRYPGSGFAPEQWADFLLDYKGPVDQNLTGYTKWADGQIAELTGDPPESPENDVPHLALDADLSKVKLATLAVEIERLEGVFNADKLVRDQYAALSRRIAQETSALQTLQARLQDAQGAAERRRALQLERSEAYQRVFEALIAEERELATLYAPVKARLETASDTLHKLGFSVFRKADAAAWAEDAEENLLDRRQTGPFKGRGALVEKAEAELKLIWETGSAAEAKDAMNGFIASYQDDLLAHAPVPREQHDAFRAWLGQFAQWLFSTDHVAVRYGIAYDGVHIERLSPGTRGIVLLLLYLALDDADDRPLLIDQPEENLDPKSVFDELVPLFIAAKAKRQVIMVTHNANLVVNTDADQIIIAEAGPHADGGLPCITYRAGGLESAEVRKSVCNILEGGGHAFRERARRLRVRLER